MATNTITVVNTAIDISAVTQAVREHRNLLVAIDKEDAYMVLKYFSPIPGVKDSITLGRTQLGSVGHRYTGQFIGQSGRGVVEPRDLKVYPCVMEMADEPEKYRRAYITQVAGGLDPNKHPFEIWLNNWGVKSASKELHDAIMTASYDANASDKSYATAFNGPKTILQAEITSKKISVDNGNMYATGAFTRADIGDKLKDWYRSLPVKMQSMDLQLMCSWEVADMYDDWLDDQGTLVTGSGAETADSKVVRNTNGKLRICRCSGLTGQFCWITPKDNQYYGFDQMSDMNTLVPFDSGNPYLYSAAGKFVLGFQFESIDKYIFSCNNQGVQIPD